MSILPLHYCAKLLEFGYKYVSSCLASSFYKKIEIFGHNAYIMDIDLWGKLFEIVFISLVCFLFVLGWIFFICTLFKASVLLLSGTTIASVFFEIIQVLLYFEPITFRR